MNAWEHLSSQVEMLSSIMRQRNKIQDRRMQELTQVKASHYTISRDTTNCFQFYYNRLFE